MAIILFKKVLFFFKYAIKFRKDQKNIAYIVYNRSENKT